MSQHEEERSDNSNRSSRYGRWDIVALMVVVLLALGMLIPSLQNIRGGSSNRSKCLNNLRQIGLATIDAHSAYNRVPPAYGTFGNRPPTYKTPEGEKPHSATLFYYLLPHLEASGIFARLPPLYHYPAENQYVLAPAQPLGGQPDENASSFVERTYICPSDESADPSGLTQLSLTPGKVEASNWGQNSYAANYLLFGMVKERRLPESVPDGLSVTIFFTEKASRCENTANGRTGGNLWAVPPFFPSDPKALVNYGGTVGFDPAENNPTKPYAMTLFQMSPSHGKCNPTLAQSPHTEVINVGMGDGSARSIRSTVSAKTWSALMTPYPIQAGNFPGGAQGRSDVPDFDWE
jgi:hypothetical protein